MGCPWVARGSPVCWFWESSWVVREVFMRWGVRGQLMGRTCAAQGSMECPWASSWDVREGRTWGVHVLCVRNMCDTHGVSEVCITGVVGVHVPPICRPAVVRG